MKRLLIATTILSMISSVELANAQILPPSPTEQRQIYQAVPAQAWSNVQVIKTLTGHTAAIDSLAFSFDDKILVSGGSYNDPLARFWWLKTGRQIENLRAQRSAVSNMLMSPDGTTLISSGDDSGINIWDWATGKYVATFLEHDANIMSLAFTPDSKILVSGALDGIKVWRINPNRPLYTLLGFGNPIYAVAISPDGEIIASGDNQGKVKFWKLKTGILISEFSPHQEAISSVIFTPDGKLMITASYDRTIKVWNLATGEILYTLTGHSAMIRALALNPDGQVLASASNDGIRLWDLYSGRLLNHLTDHNDWVESLAFSFDGKTLASGGYDFNIKLWQPVALEDR